MHSKLGHRIRQICICATSALVLLDASVAAGDTIDHGGYRPHYQGFGVNTPGGRGGTVFRVTNLNNSGDGSLRAAMEAGGPRFVIFEVSGTIPLSSIITVLNPYITVAGQTAPSPGISIRNYGLNIDTHDVVIQHLRFRQGNTAATHDDGATILIGTGNGGAEVAAYNVIIDHVSCAWSMYMCFSVYDVDGIISGPRHYPYHPYDVSFIDCLWAYDLRQDYQFTGMGGGLGAINAADYGPDNIGGLTMARSLFVHNSHRQPLSGTGRRWQVVNNVIYGSGPSSEDQLYAGIMLWLNAGLGGNNTNPLGAEHAVIIGNVYIPSLGTGSGGTNGSDSGNHTLFFDIHQENVNSQDNRIWLADNQGPYITGASGSGQKAGILWSTSLGGQDFSAADIWYASPPSWHAQMNFNTLDTSGISTSVFATAGARPLDRDAVDTTAVAAAAAGALGDRPRMGSRIVSQDDMGSWPTLAVNNRSLTVPANPNSLASGQSFRTNIEMWLESVAQAVENRLHAPTGLRITQ